MIRRPPRSTPFPCPTLSRSLHNRLACGGRPLWLEQGELHAGHALLSSPVAWAGLPIQASLWAVAPEPLAALERSAEHTSEVVTLQYLLPSSACQIQTPVAGA